MEKVRPRCGQPRGSRTAREQNKAGPRWSRDRSHDIELSFVHYCRRYGRLVVGRRGASDEEDADGVAFSLDANLAAILCVVSGRYQRLRSPLGTLQYTRHTSRSKKLRTELRTA